MKVGIMQPYLFPYLGYFQLINAVDKYVIYDDVNYIKQGWINRNRILINDLDHFITLKLSGASSFKKINQIEIINNTDNLLKTICLAYGKAPYFKETYKLIKDIFSFDNLNLGVFLSNSIKKICLDLYIKTEIINSSNIEQKDNLKGQERVIYLCESLKADCYYNAIGGESLYSKEEFNKHNIKLFFLQPQNFVYRQFNSEFIPWLSIIDVMMFNSRERIIDALNNYKLV